MALQFRQVVVPYFITVFSLFSRYNSLKKDPPSYNYFEEVVAAGYDPQAYPSYFTTIQDGKLKGLVRTMTEVLSLRRLGNIIRSTSTKTVKVDDFGATGDGTDDTEVIQH